MHDEMKKYGIYLLAYALVAAAGCRRAPEPVPPCVTIDILGCRDSTLLLSALTDTVIYTKLEPTASDPNPPFEPRLISFKNYLVVLFPDILNNSCQVYRKNEGRFLGRIVAEKQIVAPGKETGSYLNVNYALVTDETGNFLFGRSYVKERDQFTYYFLRWNLRTFERVDSVKAPSGYPMVSCYFGAGRFVCLHFNYARDEVRPKVTVVEPDGRIAGTIPERRTFRIEPGTNYGSYLTDMSTYRKGNTFRYHNAHAADTVFAITPDLKEYPVYRLDCGDKTYPYYYEARVPREKFHPEKYYAVHLLRESANYLFFQYRYEGDLYYGLYDTRSGRLKVSREDLAVRHFRHSEGGLSNDIDGGLPFWPQIITDDDEAGCVQQVGDIRRRLLSVTDESLKARPAYRNLWAFIRELPDEAYVVVAVRIVH